MIRKTEATKAVLAALRASPDTSGYEICQATGLASGTVYPILHRLRENGIANTTLGGAWFMTTLGHKFMEELDDKDKSTAGRAAQGEPEKAEET